MNQPFDPYHKWLGILPKDQPPNAYRLLGVELFEDDLDTISHAADRQMAHVRTFQNGPHSKFSQLLLNQLSSARVLLLDTANKAKYDVRLKEALAAQAPLAGSNQTSAEADFSALAEMISQSGSGPAAARSKKPATTIAAPRKPARSPGSFADPKLWAAAGAGLVCIIGLLIWIATRNSGQETKPDNSTPAFADSSAKPAETPQTAATTTATARPTAVQSPATVPATAAARVKNLGGSITPDDDQDDLSIVKVDLSRRALAEDDWQALSSFKNLKTLLLASTATTDAQVAILADLVELKALDLSDNPAITGESLRVIEELPKLSALRIKGTGIGDGELAEFAQRRPGLQIAGLKPKPATTNVEARPAVAARPAVVPPPVTPLAPLPDTLPPAPVPVSRLDALRNLQTLTQQGKLNANGSNGQIHSVNAMMDDEQLAWLAPLPELETAYLNGGSIHGRGLVALINVTGLRVLLLGNCPLEPEQLTPLGHLQQLAELNVWHTDFDDRNLAQVGRLSRLRWLGLDETRITDQGLRGLAGMSSLQALRLRGDHITDVGIRDLPVLPNLRFLDLQGTEITDAAVPALAKLTTLARLNVTRTHVSATAVAELKKLLPAADVIGATQKDEASAARFQALGAGQAIDLLAKIDRNAPPKGDHAMLGNWNIESHGAVSPGSGRAWLQIDYPPLEYDLKLVVERLKGIDSVNLSVPIDGGAVSVCIDTDRGTGNWLEAVDGDRYYGGDGTESASHVLPTGSAHDLLCQVRQSGIRVYCDGKPLINWVGESRRLSLKDFWRVGDPKAIYIGSWSTSYRFSKIELRQVVDIVATKRGPFPSEDELKTAKLEVQAAFKRELTLATAPAQKMKLADNLLKAGDESADQPARLAASQTLAAELVLAANTKDTEAKFEEIARRCSSRFAVSAAENKARWLSAALNKAEIGGRATLVRISLPIIGELGQVEEFNLADKLLEQCRAVTATIVNKSLASKVDEAAGQLDVLRKNWQAAEKAAETLKNNPADPAANLLWGAYLCQMRNDWATALPLLARVADPALKNLATRDLAAPSTPAEQLKLADGWYDFKSPTDPHWSAAARKRAYLWYEKAAPQLKGIDKIHVQSRTREIREALSLPAGQK